MTSQAITYGYEPTGDIFQPLNVNTSGVLKTEFTNASSITVGSLKAAYVTVLGVTADDESDNQIKQKVFMGLHDTANNLIRSAQCDASANLKTTSNITRTQIGTNISIAASGSSASNSVEIKNGSNSISVEILTGGTVSGNDINATLQASQDNSTFYALPHGLFDKNQASSFHRFIAMYHFKPKYLRAFITNQGSSTDTFNVYVSN